MNVNRRPTASRGSHGANAVRVIGGRWKRSVLRFPDAPDLRPTPDRVRETLFNWLGHGLVGKRCLDLFAGTGALGIEALSRGAAHVTFVDRSAAAIAALRANLERLARSDATAPGVRFERSDALESLARDADERYDIVFLDPPFGAGWIDRVMPRLPAWLGARGVAYVETEARHEPAIGWRLLKEGRAGAVHFALVTREGEEE
jgi:16S rRNA (guanine966-N2)-methyltransferase